MAGSDERATRWSRRDWLRAVAGAALSAGCADDAEDAFAAGTDAGTGGGTGGGGGGGAGTASDAAGGTGGAAANAGAAGTSGSGGAADSGVGGSSGTAGDAACTIGPGGEFQTALPIPPVLTPTSTDATTDYYAITMRTGSAALRPGAGTEIWGFDGRWPGPTIVARSGRRVVVRQTNQLPEAVSIHLHGGHMPAASDGYPTDLIQPGSYKDYEYPNLQEAASLWYHDHAMDRTGEHVLRGLAGMYIVTDDVEQNLGLPSGSHDVPLLLQDRTLDSSNALVYVLDSQTIDQGFRGNLYCVNGAITPYCEVANVKYRFRLLNGSNARTYVLELDSGDPLIVIASDGGLLQAPVSKTRLEIAPAERFDFVIDFAKYPVCSSVVLRDVSSFTSWNVMRFDVVRLEPDTSSIPQSLRMLTRLDPSTATRTRSFTLDSNNGSWLINDMMFDESRVDATPALGTTEIWEFDNSSGEMHPMHVHLVQFQILDIDGSAPPAELAGWKDTVRVPRRSRVRVIARFADYRGRYVFHCHILEHEDHHMMSQFEVV